MLYGCPNSSPCNNKLLVELFGCIDFRKFNCIIYYMYYIYIIVIYIYSYTYIYIYSYMLYRCPNSSPCNNKLLVEPFGCIDFRKFDCICIVGDFNHPKIGWSNICIVSGDDKQIIDAS